MFVVSRGRVAAVRTVSDGPAARVEVDAAIAEASQTPLSHAPEHADELLLVAGFLRRPGPELQVVDLDSSTILAA
jgi:hypothetical protein